MDQTLKKQMTQTMMLAGDFLTASKKCAWYISEYWNLMRLQILMAPLIMDIDSTVTTCSTVHYSITLLNWPYHASWHHGIINYSERGKTLIIIIIASSLKLVF